EAFYRKLPVLAVTGTQAYSRIGHHVAQVIDRSSVPNDAVNLSLSLPIVKDDLDVWDCEIKVNKALLELKRDGGGPVHINLPTTYSRTYSTKELPSYRMIMRYTNSDELPSISKFEKIAIFIGSHNKWNREEIEAVEQFCERNNAVVFCDHTSGYNGRFKLNFALAAAQKHLNKSALVPDLLIHIGEISGDYPTLELPFKEVWRVNEDGELRDTFKKLTNVFQMSEKDFFTAYLSGRNERNEYYNTCVEALQQLREVIPSDLPFSNLWVAKQLHSKIPSGATLHFGILNSLRAWNFFELDSTITTASNVGGFGIDGGLSTLIGASLYNRDKLYF